MRFDLYFAASASCDFGIQKFLFSQYNDRATINKLYHTLSKTDVKVFLDSGAYTAFTKNVNIDIDDYINYINTNIDMFNIVACVDVIPKCNTRAESMTAANKSWENFLYMRQRVKKSNIVMPVFHYSESFDNLIRILQYEDEYGKIEYLGIGGIAPIKNSTTRNSFLSKCFEIIQKYNATIKVHGFGMTDLNLLEQFSFSSADSTTWRMAAVMGEIMTKFGRIVVSENRKNDISYRLNFAKEREVIKNYVQHLGFELSELESSADARAHFNVAFLQEWENSYVCKYKFLSSRKSLF